MIEFSEIYCQAISLFDDPDITMAYDLNKINFAKMMYPFLNSSLSLFTNPSMIGRMLSLYEKPQGRMEVFESDGETITFKLSFIPVEKSLMQFFIDGREVDASYDNINNTVTFSEKIEKGKEYAVESYYQGCFTENLNITGNHSIDNDVRNKVISILARLLVLSWGEKTKNFLLDIQNILTDTDFRLHPASNALNSKIAFVQQLTEEVYQLQNKLSHIIRFASSADWGRRYN